MHIYSGAPYIPMVASSNNTKYRRVIDNLRARGDRNLILAMEMRAQIINLILTLDPNADFFITCTGHEQKWEITFEKISTEARGNVIYLSQSCIGTTLQISFPESGK